MESLVKIFSARPARGSWEQNNPHPTCHLIKVIDVEVSIDGTPVYLLRIQTIIPIDQVQLRSTGTPYRVRTSYCRYNPLCKDKQTPARSRQRGTFAGRDRNMLPIYITRREKYIHATKMHSG